MAPTIPSRSADAVPQEHAQAAQRALLESVTAVPIYRLAIELENLTPVTLSEYPGSALRGALVQALLDTHCTNKAAPSCAACPLVAACPVSALVAPLRDEAPRGRDVPRPFVITPPATTPPAGAGGRWEFGLTVFGSAAALLPYVVLSRARLESNGLGWRDEAGRRGRVRVARIAGLSAAGRVPLYEPGRARIGAPAAEHGGGRLAAYAAGLPSDRLTLRLLTPLRLKDGGEILRGVSPAALVHRILERWEGLRREYLPPGVRDPLASLRGGPAMAPDGDPRALLAIADTVRVERDGTRWRELASYSSRQRAYTPISGLVGEATIVGNLGPLREVLALGELIHAGKDVVKGNGCYAIAGANGEEMGAWN